MKKIILGMITAILSLTLVGCNMSSEDILDELKSFDTVLVEISINDKTQDYVVTCEDTCVWGTLDGDNIVKINTPYATYTYDEPTSTWIEVDQPHTYYGYLQYPFDQFTYDEEKESYYAENVNMGSQFSEVTLSLNNDNEIVDTRVKETGLEIIITYKDLDADFDVDLSDVCPDTYEDGICQPDYTTYFDFTPNTSMTLTDLDNIIDDIRSVFDVYDPLPYVEINERYRDEYSLTPLEYNTFDASEREPYKMYPDDVYQDSAFYQTRSIESTFYNDVFMVLSLIDHDEIVLGHSNTLTREYEQIMCCTQYGETIEVTEFNGNITVFIDDNALYVDFSLYDEDDLSKREIFLIKYDNDTLISLQSYQFDNALDDVILSNRLSVIDYHQGDTGTVLQIDNYWRDTAGVTYTSIEEDGSYTTYLYSDRTD